MMKKKGSALLVCGGVVYCLAVTLIVVCSWYHRTYQVGLRELLYTLLGPLEGTSSSVVELALRSCLPPVALAMAAYVLACLFARKSLWMRRTLALGSCVLLAGALLYANERFDITGYLASLRESSDIYEREYVDPAQAVIREPEEKRNLIYILVESLETTYMATQEGGLQKVNLMPNLTQLARDNLTFTGTRNTSGFRNISGASWTMASILAQTAGIPFAFPVEGNAMDGEEYFAPKLTTLGDILQTAGYSQIFLCGSDATFGGRRKYFTQHGDYQISDLFTAREAGYVEEDYYVWWGYEDFHLFDIARDTLTQIARDNQQPFNLTLITADLHHTGGYFCDMCDVVYSATTADVVNCTDLQVAEFVAWCQEQPFYENTTIIVAGDHPRMDTLLVEGAEDAQRTIYNCFINAAATVKGEREGRVFTALDMFPTTLEALGFEVEGGRLGLGVSLFAKEQTLAERLGVEALDAELTQQSEYYLDHFYYAE